MAAALDILIPTYNRAAALAVTLTSLTSQTFRDFNLIISDQSTLYDVETALEVLAVARVLRWHGHTVTFHKHLPRRGMAEQRQFLLDQATAPYVLFSDDDLIYEPDAVERMLKALREHGCGFAGMAVAGLSYLDDVRPHQQAIEFWEGRVEPEDLNPGMPEWNRVKVNSAANIIHVAQNYGITPETQRVYKTSWMGGCCMFDTAKLRDCGGYDFWKDLPAEHAGEDVEAQNRVMRRYGGCGVIPTGVYHMELETTIANRDVDAPYALRKIARQEV